MEDHNSLSASPDYLIRIETKELEELSQYIKEADIELHQVGGTLAPSNLIMLGLGNIHLQVGSYGSAVISNATSDRERFGLLYKIDNTCTTKCNGRHIHHLWEQCRTHRVQRRSMQVGLHYTRQFFPGRALARDRKRQNEYK